MEILLPQIMSALSNLWEKGSKIPELEGDNHNFIHFLLQLRKRYEKPPDDETDQLRTKWNHRSVYIFLESSAYFIYINMMNQWTKPNIWKI